jgi:hypothetical protein
MPDFKKEKRYIAIFSPAPLNPQSGSKAYSTGVFS